MKNIAIAALLGFLSADQVNAHWLDKFSLVQTPSHNYVQESVNES